ncbi:hypothetical protein M426DRAFT_76635 [Hypoxylon sp. CI-4A]|nr:hypothetical protein M426DRAFT_76635 [Hypoxylon sp. CI-4A]
MAYLIPTSRRHFRVKLIWFRSLTHYQAEHLIELQGNVSEAAIEHCQDKIPPFSEGDVIHDNACESSVVTQTVMSLKPPSIQIFDTEIKPQFNGWPVTSAVVSAQNLTFPDEKFTHSFTTFAFHCLGNHVRAARQTYRTLKPGGTAVASIWISMPHVDALPHAHWFTRGREGPMPESYLTMPDVKRWAQLAWSYLGMLPRGFQNDEDKWDEALEDIVKQINTGARFNKNEREETVMTMVACITVAKKQRNEVAKMMV